MSLPDVVEGPDRPAAPGSQPREVWFTELYTQLGKRIYQAIMVRADGDRSEAEEVTAEAFIRAFRAWELVAVHPQPVAWLLLVARNISIDRDRARRRRGEDRQISLEAATSEIDAHLPRELELPFNPALATAINKRLTPQQREVIACRVLAGLSVQATASMIGTTAGTVRTQCHVALRSLRDELGDAGELM